MGCVAVGLLGDVAFPRIEGPVAIEQDHVDRHVPVDPVKGLGRQGLQLNTERESTEIDHHPVEQGAVLGCVDIDVVTGMAPDAACIGRVAGVRQDESDGLGVDLQNLGFSDQKASAVGDDDILEDKPVADFMFG